MDILQKQSQKILRTSKVNYLISLMLSALLWACGGNDETTEMETTDSTKHNSQTVSLEDIKVPDALDNFDKSYSGNIGDTTIHLNLRRYGNEISGSYWNEQTGVEYILKGEVQADGETFMMEAFVENGVKTGSFAGNLREPSKIEGEWENAVEEASLSFLVEEITEIPILKLKLDDIELHEKSSKGDQTLNITYPHLAGIQDKGIANKVNSVIETYFESATLLDSINKATFPFSEDVTYNVTYFKENIISICKHHQLSKNNDTYLFDDSHGININFKRGKVYEVQDLFKPNALDELNKVILQKINKSCGGTLDEERLKICKIKKNETTSFSLGKDKITFHLTERLPRKQKGCGYVMIEYKDLENFFNPSGPLKKTIN